MDTLDLYEEENAFGFKRNIRKLLTNMLIINGIFWIFLAWFYLHIFGLKLPPDRITLIEFCVAPLAPLIGSIIPLISDRINYWNVMFKKIGDSYYLYKKGEKVSKRVCSVVNLWKMARYNYGRYVSVIDEDGKEIMIFKGLSKKEAAEVCSDISTRIQIPIKLVE